ncbi:cytochrome P450 4c21-like [Uranotaenia lowii]|uniref:cytochrome P450 4c21-like n=1 Tax=Uranotaenia lowii TaxID=190385 RepID=UPI0024789A7E|nr:cytochrome P450 4c21-like [Uranotaenia lowii]
MAIHLYLLFTAIVLALGCSWWRIRARRAFAKNIPVNINDIMFMGMDMTMFFRDAVGRFDYYNKMFLKHERMFVAMAGPLFHLALSHPDLIQKVLSHPKCLDKPYLYDFVEFELGLFSARYHQWKRVRKAANPTFNLRILHSFIPLFDTCCKRMIKRLKQNEDGATIDLFKYTLRASAEMVCVTTMGGDVLQHKDLDELIHYTDVAMDLVSARFLNLHHHFDIVYMLSSNYWKEKACRKRIVELSVQIMKDHRAKMQRETASGSTAINNVDSETDEPLRKPVIFIDQFLSESSKMEPFSEEEIVHNVATLLAAGSDTSGNVTAHAALFLAIYPEIQEKVFQEINEICPDESVEITPELLKKLTYTEMFLKETLRHCPVGPNIGRKNLVDIELDGIIVPAGTTFLVSLHALHRQKAFWGPDPEKFDPDNFLPERVKDRNPYAFLPFSIGARNCIGERYGMISMKIMFIYIVRNFKLHTKLKHEELKYKFDITLKLNFPHAVQQERREKLIDLST